MMYTPHPVDLTGIKLDITLQNDIEKIAKNIHETWAKQRQDQGWGYSETYDAVSKKHPCMVEYNDLPESERDIDRATVVQTIKMLLWMGYEIRKE